MLLPSESFNNFFRKSEAIAWLVVTFADLPFPGRLGTSI